MNKCHLNTELSSHEGTRFEFNRSTGAIKSAEGRIRPVCGLGIDAETASNHVVVTFEGFGLEIRQEQGDEIYGSVHGLVGSQGYTKEFVVPEQELGPEGNNRIAQLGIVLWEGPPIDLGIVLSLAEHDNGDRETVRKEIRDRVKQVSEKAGQVLAGGALGGGAAQNAGVAMQAESSQSESLWDWVRNGIADLIDKILGLGDDPYNPIGFTISEAMMRNIPPLQKYRCSNDPILLDVTEGLAKMMRSKDNADDLGQITACFTIRPK